MPEGGTGEHDLLRMWLEGSRAFLNANAGNADLWPQCERLFRTWAQFYENTLGMAADHSGKAKPHPFDPAGWLGVDGDGGMADLWRWLEGPELANGTDGFRDLIRESREWMAYQSALEKVRAVTARGWLRSFEKFVDAAGKRLEVDASTQAGWEQYRDLWREIADVELAGMQRSEDFLAAQRDLIRTQVDLRAAMRARFEKLADLIGLPTRAELDDLHETVDLLRRELATLQAGRKDQGGK